VLMRRAEELDIVLKKTADDEYLSQSCTAFTHGGQETTLVTMMIPLLHLGILIVGVPYSVEGCSTRRHAEAHHMPPRRLPGDRGELQPTAEDLSIAQALGRRVAEIAPRLRG
jgi:NAD(P)H dehydrogenase (quinone)